MEGEKRKAKVNGAVLGESQKRAREDANEEVTTVTEEEVEVEEFFAIIRRIHAAVDYFKKGNGDIRNLTNLGKVESLNLGRNVEVNCGMKKKKAKNVEDNGGLDLNADPGTGSDPF